MALSRDITYPSPMSLMRIPNVLQDSGDPLIERPNRVQRIQGKAERFWLPFHPTSRKIEGCSSPRAAQELLVLHLGLTSPRLVSLPHVWCVDEHWASSTGSREHATAFLQSCVLDTEFYGAILTGLRNRRCSPSSSSFLQKQLPHMHKRAS